MALSIVLVRIKFYLPGVRKPSKNRRLPVSAPAIFAYRHYALCIHTNLVQHLHCSLQHRFVYRILMRKSRINPLHVSSQKQENVDPLHYEDSNTLCSASVNVEPQHKPITFFNLIQDWKAYLEVKSMSEPLPCMCI